MYALSNKYIYIYIRSKNIYFTGCHPQMFQIIGGYSLVGWFRFCFWPSFQKDPLDIFGQANLPFESICEMKLDPTFIVDTYDKCR